MTGAELARTEQGGALARMDEIYLGVPVEQIIARVTKIQEVQTRVMKLEHHYGVVPGTKGKPSLFKPGAELLCLTFQLAPDFTTEERWDGEHLECVVKCTLVHGPTEVKVGSGLGSCSTRESKYAYRNGKRKCPSCGNDSALNKSKRDSQGFYCWAKAGGCGANFDADDKRITEQQVGRVPNPDLADQYNTVRKMACKRALVAAVLITCGASELFTQDVEDMPRDGGGHGGGDDGGGWDGGGPPGPGYDGYGYGDGRDGSPPRQQRSNGGQRSQNGDRADDNRGRSSGGGGNGADPAKSAEATTRMLEAFAQSTTANELDELAPELNLLKNERALTVDDYRKLRDAYSARARELKGSARQSA